MTLPPHATPSRETEKERESARERYTYTHRYIFETPTTCTLLVERQRKSDSNREMYTHLHPEINSKSGAPDIFDTPATFATCPPPAFKDAMGAEESARESCI